MLILTKKSLLVPSFSESFDKRLVNSFFYDKDQLTFLDYLRFNNRNSYQGLKTILVKLDGLAQELRPRRNRRFSRRLLGGFGFFLL